VISKNEEDDARHDEKLGREPKRFLHFSREEELEAKINQLLAHIDTQNKVIRALESERDYWRRKAHERLGHK